MSTFSNLTVADADAGVIMDFVNGAQDLSIFYAFVAVALTAVILSGFQAGRKVILRMVWSLDRMLGGAPHTVTLPGPPGLPITGNLLELKDGHTVKIAEWTKKYGDVIRVSLGEREAVFINSHKALAKTVVQQGPAYQSRPTFKLFHSDFASSGIWTVGTSPYSDRLARTRKALSSQIAPRLLPIYTPIIHPKLKKLFGNILEISQGPAIDMAEKLHRFGTGQVSEQLMGQHLDDDMVGMLAENETNIFRQRTIGSPPRDYVPILRGVGWLRYVAGKTLGIKDWTFDEKEEKAREYRKKQQVYINKMLVALKDRVASGDETPSILGNIIRQGLLKDEEILLASYTGIAAGVNLGYSLTWIIGYLANRPDLQHNGYVAIREVYNGEPPKPHEYDRVGYIKALHTEGSRIYTPVRLGFPRQTLDGASYNGHKIPRDMLVIMNLMAGNRDPVAFDHPDEFLPERWLDGHKGRTDLLVEGGEKLGVTHLTYGAGRRVCPGIDMANRGLYSTLVLLLHFFTWERQPLGEEQKKLVFLPFRAERECTLEMDAIADTATPTEAQAIPWSAGIKFHCRDTEGLHAWLASEEH
ncbi:putative cytochrome P450 phenylacetate 2-hydroxylase [Dothidotthia symphoricarpi CBS 119687]|uniref:Putative cytochrome P450 phenylacetate 2-hydroxylase n=1 Tax=Dothidotthia symphoricarpi CBS 119687 TaxID=1392245 RepID=A0A6A6AAB2_9PLEO|nr:putative cytochrome P450 phenylacetate 2-hydroxylase [Dothidotthia symphoricarpi CBS 119687]KAF2128862.1 putative cytochrome P450 phenylacetate 2-hydroxylase [Dothidotthia symphoricarpi CBS 119687]